MKTWSSKRGNVKYKFAFPEVEALKWMPTAELLALSYLLDQDGGILNYSARINAELADRVDTAAVRANQLVVPDEGPRP